MGLVAAAACVAFAYIGAAQPAQTKNQTPAAANTDQNGDPLPPGAIARMGSLRWRHGSGVSYLAFTPDGKAVLTASQDGIVRLWERDTGKELRRFQGPPQRLPPILPQPVNGVFMPGGGTVSGVAMSQDGKLLATVEAINSIQLWDVDSGKEIRRLKGPANGIATIRFAPDGKSLAARGFDRTTTIFDTQTGKQIAQIIAKQPKGPVRIAVGGRGIGSEGLAFSHDGKTIASAEIEFGMQKTTISLKLSDTQTGKEIRRIDVSKGGVASAAFSANGKFLAYASGNAIHLCEADSGKEIHTIENKFPIAGLSFASDSKTLAAKGRDQVIRLYGTDTGKGFQEFGQASFPAGNQGFVFFGFGQPEIRDFAFSPDGKILATGSGQTVRFWNVATGKEQAALGGHRGPISAILLTPDGKTMLSRGADNVIRRWDASTGKELGQFTEPRGTNGVAFSPDGKTVALANANGSIRLHACADGKELHQLKGHVNGTAAMAFSPDSKKLASRGSSDNQIRVYDVAKGSELKQINVPGPDPRGGLGGGLGFVGGPGGKALAFSPDGHTLAANISANSAGPVRVVGQPPAAGENLLRMWDVNTGKEIRKITLPSQRIVTNLAYSPDGRLLATENADRTVSIWEIASGKERALLGSPPAPVVAPPTPAFGVLAGGGPAFSGPLTPTTLAFSPDGELLATRGPGNSVRVWEVAPAKEIGLFKGHDGGIGVVSFAPNGKAVASGSTDTTILVWDVARLSREPKAVIELAANQVESLWADLIGNDAIKASSSIRKLAAAPKNTTPFVADRVKPAAPPDIKKIEQWIADLDSENFKKRAHATEELERIGDLAVPALEKVLVSMPAVEMLRRVQAMLEKMTTGTLTAEQIRLVRAVEVLEKLNTSEARQVLEALAQGAPGALTTRHAQAVLDRQARRR
jgi:WD40 repeat protein